MRNPRLNSLAAKHIKEAAKKVAPGTIQKWSVIIDGVEFPIKQIVREAANIVPIKSAHVTPADFIAHDAVRILRRLGFEVKYYE